MKEKKVIITKVVKIDIFLHIEGLVNGKEQYAYLYLDSLEKLEATEKLLFEEAKKQRAELFI
jgi:hypothetical protein